MRTNRRRVHSLQLLMDASSPAPPERRWPLWLVSGGLFLLALFLAAAGFWLPRFLPRTDVEISYGLSFDGGLCEVEVGDSGCPIAEIDDEPSEPLRMPDANSPHRARSELDVFHESVMEMEFQGCQLWTDPPRRRPVQTNFYGTGIYSGPGPLAFVESRCGHSEPGRCGSPRAAMASH
jgi:hypothetical protein